MIGDLSLPRLRRGRVGVGAFGAAEGAGHPSLADARAPTPTLPRAEREGGSMIGAAA